MAYTDYSDKSTSMNKWLEEIAPKYFGKTVHPNIRRCLNGITKKAYGYRWMEIEDGEDLDNFRLAF